MECQRKPKLFEKEPTNQKQVCFSISKKVVFFFNQSSNYFFKFPAKIFLVFFRVISFCLQKILTECSDFFFFVDVVYKTSTIFSSFGKFNYKFFEIT